MGGPASGGPVVGGVVEAGELGGVVGGWYGVVDLEAGRPYLGGSKCLGVGA